MQPKAARNRFSGCLMLKSTGEAVTAAKRLTAPRHAQISDISKILLANRRCYRHPVPYLFRREISRPVSSRSRAGLTKPIIRRSIMAYRDVARGAPWAMGCLCLLAAKLAHSATRAASGARPRIYNFCFGGPILQSFSESARHGRFVTDLPADPAAIDARRYAARLTLRPAMDDAEILMRAREAHIAVSRPSRWRARRIRAGSPTGT